MKRKQKYLKALLSCDSLWIMRSFQNPNQYMTKTDLLLHAIAYRKLTGINLYKLEK